jgi:hypothetical protein
VSEAVRQVVLAAFRLDAAGDRGERDEVGQATAALVAAVGVIEAAFTTPRP